MQRYRITTSDGTVHEIDGPDNATREQVLAAIEADIASERIAKAEEEYEAYLADRIEVQPEPEDTDNFLEDIYKGLAAGAIQTLEMAALGAVAPLGEEAETSARDVIKSVADTVRPELANPEGALSKLSQGVGSILGFAPALLAGPAAAPFITAGLAVGAGAGEASERARTADASVEERGRAALLGTLPGALDIIPLARLSRKFGPDVVEELIGKFGKPEIDGIGSRIRRAAATGTIEAAQEVAQGIAQNLIERGYNEDAEILKGTGEEGLIGAGAGAIVQGLLDAFAGRRGPSATTPTEPAKPVEPTQGELFSPDADLGVRPPIEESKREAQGELFPAVWPQLAPEKDTQFDLFGPAGSPEAELRRQIRASQLEKERAMRSSEPIAPFEEGRDYPFFERASVDTAEAGRRLAELEGRREPTQEELPFEYVPDVEAEQVAQAAARERAALTAIERSDEAAFEQPDLFALQQEQEDRRLGTPRWPVDQFMADPEIELERQGLLEPEVTPVPVPEAEQLNIEDAIETAQLEEMIAAEDAARAEAQLARIGKQISDKQTADTAQRRGAILDSVLAESSTTSQIGTEQRFSKALARDGIANTTPTTEEKEAITRRTYELEDARTDIIEPRQQYQMRPDEEGVPRRAPQTDLRELEEVRGPDARKPIPRQAVGDAVPLAAGVADRTS